MSYFPSGDIPTPPSSNSPHHSCFTTPSQRQQPEWTDEIVSHYGYPPQRQSPYTTQAYYGLGLPNIPGTAMQSRIETGMAHGHFETPAPFIWPSQFGLVKQPPVYQQQLPQIQQWDDGSCDPLSTLMPAALWGHPQFTVPSNVMQHSSPAPSGYAASSYPSAVSSPYARSDSVVRPADSPLIKIETATPASAVHENSPPTAFGIDDTTVKHVNATTYPTGSRLGLLAPSICLEKDEPELSVVPRSRPRASSLQDMRKSKKKRTHTKPDTATCSCDQCGQLFQRTYNLRAHMETHDPHRSHPFACTYDSCSKEFVRRTDLIRHQHSVHLKERPHACQRCGCTFARRDTLRRHEDDGCPKREEVKKRVSRGRRASSASILKRSGSRWKREDSSTPLDTWEDVPEFAA